MGFQYAGSLTGTAPIVRKFQSGENMYVGQLVMSGVTGGLGAHVQILDAPTLLKEDVLNPIGMVTGIVDGSRAWTAAVSGTAQYGEGTTYTATKSVIADTGVSEVEVTYILPMNTLIRAPIYNTVWGTALTECVCTTAHAGTVISHTGNAVTDMMEDHTTIYCRSGANRGHYRVVTGTTTTAQTVTQSFPYTTALGDVFVVCAGVLGNSYMDIGTGCDCIDGDNALAASIQVFYHEINLEESGKEYAVFSLLNFGHGHGTYDAIST